MVESGISQTHQQLPDGGTERSTDTHRVRTTGEDTSNEDWPRLQRDSARSYTNEDQDEPWGSLLIPGNTWRGGGSGSSRGAIRGRGRGIHSRERGIHVRGRVRPTNRLDIRPARSSSYSSYRGYDTRQHGQIRGTVIGSDTSDSGIRAAQKHQRPRPTGPGVFVSRLHPGTKTNDVVTHIRSKTGLRVEVVQLQTKFRSYSSFFVAIDKSSMSRLLDPKQWPKDTLVKEYV